MQQACCSLPPLPPGQARHAAAISGRGGRGMRRRCAPAAASHSAASHSSSSGVCWPHGPPALVPAAAVVAPCRSGLGCVRPPAALQSRVVPRTLFSDWRGGPLGGDSSSNGRSSPGPKQQQQQQQPPLPGTTAAAAAGGHARQQPSQQQPNNFFSIAAQAALGASTHLTGSGGVSRQQQQFSDSSTGSGSDGGGGRGTSAKQLLQTAVHSLDMFEPRELGSSSYEEHEAAMESDEEGGMQGGTLATAHIVKANYEVLRLDEAGAVRRLRIKRRDLLREHRLQPRDLRRIDPTIDFTKASPSITIKEDVLLLNLGGIRAIVTGDKALLFEPASSNTRKLLDTLVPRLQASAGQRLLARQQQAAAASSSADGGSGGSGGSSSGASNPRQAGSSSPFELEVLEGVLMVATGRLDAEVLSVTRRVGELLQKLPRDINPVNLEELRRIKQALVELENKSDMLREMLEQIMDDEDELREINLSSRPRREERRKQRERERMERQLTRAREEMEEQARRNSSSSNGGDADDRRSSSSGGGGNGGGGSSTASGSSGSQPASTGGSGSSSRRDGSSARQQRLAELYARHGMRRGPGGVLVPSPKGGSSGGGSSSSSRPLVEAGKQQQWESSEQWRPAIDRDGLLTMSRDPQQQQQRDGSSRERDRDRDREGDPEEEFQDAQDALEELAEQEEEEEELEEVEDLLEYYLQRSSATQSEAERLLEGARDLEESIGVSLSARRYEVNRLELMLSMGSFAAALGAMIAGIFGMNMKSTLEMSVMGFWGVTGSIVVGCFYIFLAIMRYTQKKRIL